MASLEKGSALPTPTGRGWAVGLVVLVILLLPLLYVLSIGPAVYLHKHGFLPDWIAYVYEPVNWLVESSQTAREILERYVKWFLS